MLLKHTQVFEEVKDGAAGGGAPAAGAGDAGAGAAPAAGAGAAPAAPAAGESATSLPPGSGSADARTKPAEGDKGYWPADWQARVAKGDEKRQAVLSRYASPEAVADALIAAQARIRSGELRPALPANAKPEEIAAWRKDNGIPETPAGYEITLDGGRVIGEEDKPVIEKFLGVAHEANLKPEQVKGVMNWYYQEQERLVEEASQRDETQRLETLDALNGEWGKDFRRNVNMIHSVLSRFPADVREQIEGARLPDGRGLFNHPEVMRTFAAIALELNPAGVLAPSGGGDITKSLNDEIEQIEKWMGAPRKSTEGKKYWADEKAQARYRQLLDMREKQQQRAA